ncbi:MAG: DUF167 domain-containing protein [Bacteroidetes bacterium]|nr:DUF167 domain-containing protein [Bacteroidota bacterium]
MKRLDKNTMIPLIVKIKPGAFKDEISVDAEENWIIKIKGKSIDGEANIYLIKFLATEFDLRKSDIVLEKGLTSRFKKINVNIDQARFEKLVEKYKK